MCYLNVHTRPSPWKFSQVSSLLNLLCKITTELTFEKFHHDLHKQEARNLKNKIKKIHQELPRPKKFVTLGCSVAGVGMVTVARG